MTRLTQTSSQRLLEDAVAEFARATRFPLAFGGYESGGVTTVTALWGNRTLSLNGLRVHIERGLGGRAMSECRPRITSDYARCRHITHDYDSEISEEGIGALFAVPVVLAGSARAVLYGGSRSGQAPGTTFVSAGASIARSFAEEIRVEDEVSRRVAERDDRALDGSALEEVRLGHAELHRIAADVTDPTLKARLAALEARLAALGGLTASNSGSAIDAGASPGSGAGTVHLSPRELDVLVEAALGDTNLGIGRTLGLTESTVKSYLKTAMAKLEAPTRIAAVAAARRLSLIP